MQRTLTNSLCDTNKHAPYGLDTENRRDELERMDRIYRLGEMAAGIAHEVNQPLAALVYTLTGALRHARQGALSQIEMTEVIARALDNTQRLSAIISRVRDLAAQHHPKYESVPLSVLVNEIAILCQPRVIAEQAELRLLLADNLLPVHADRVQIEQVLFNLIDNAIDAVRITRGARHITVCAAPLNGTQVELSVEDSGMGLPPERLARIFEPFYTSKPDGIGLGLAICQRIVEDHSGYIRAVNSPGHGLRVSFTLPVALSPTGGSRVSD